jgi:hypothetical protein
MESGICLHASASRWVIVKILKSRDSGVTFLGGLDAMVVVKEGCYTNADSCNT